MTIVAAIKQRGRSPSRPAKISLGVLNGRVSFAQAVATQSYIQVMARIGFNLTHEIFEAAKRLIDSIRIICHMKALYHKN